MAGDGTIGFQDAARIVLEIAAECAERTGELPATIVLVGGTALAARQVREHSHDVDVYVSQLDDDAVAAVAERHAGRYGPTFKIDATPSDTIWGAIAIRDIDASPVVVRGETTHGTVEIRALSIETLYVVKAAADREKDRADLPGLARRSTYDRIVERARTVSPWYGDRQAFPAFAERLARRVAENFDVPLSTVDRDLALPTSVTAKVEEIRRGLEAQYWPAIRELMRAAPQHLNFDPKDPGLVRFDAKAAGVPEFPMQVMRADPRRTTDLAAAVLMEVDPARNVRRIQLLRQHRGRGPDE